MARSFFLWLAVGLLFVVAANWRERGAPVGRLVAANEAAQVYAGGPGGGCPGAGLTTPQVCCGDVTATYTAGAQNPNASPGDTTGCGAGGKGGNCLPVQAFSTCGQ